MLAQEITAWATVVIAVATVLYFLMTVIAVVYARRQIADAKADRQETTRWRRLALLEELSRRWTSPLLLRARRRANKHGKSPRQFAEFYWAADAQDSIVVYELNELGNFLEYLGLSVQWNLIDEKNLLEVYRPVLLHYGEMYSEVLLDARLEGQLPYFLALYQHVKTAELEKGRAEGVTPGNDLPEAATSLIPTS